MFTFTDVYVYKLLRAILSACLYRLQVIRTRRFLASMCYYIAYPRFSRQSGKYAMNFKYVNDRKPFFTFAHALREASTLVHIVMTFTCSPVWRRCTSPLSWVTWTSYCSCCNTAPIRTRRRWEARPRFTWRHVPIRRTSSASCCATALRLTPGRE